MAMSTQQGRTPVHVPVSASRGYGRGAGSGMLPQRKRARSGSGAMYVAIGLTVLVGGGITYFAFFAPAEPTSQSMTAARQGAGEAGERFIGPETTPQGAPSGTHDATHQPTVISMAGQEGLAQTQTTQAQHTQVPPTPGAPGTVQPGTTQPGTTQPGTTQPGTTQPGTTPRPGGNQPGMGQPGGGQPGGGGMQPVPQAMSMVQVLMTQAQQEQSSGKLLEARTTYNKALFDASATASDRSAIRKAMSEINQTLVFSPTFNLNDPMCVSYTVGSGDVLERIMRKEQLLPDKMFIARVNKLSDPNKLKIGQKLKLVKGPFHAVVSKSQFRLDIYAGPVPTSPSTSTSSLPDGAEPGWTYITSFPVGLGEGTSAGTGTPTGVFVVKAGSKLENPHWVNPRTGEKFDAKDPKNPIGERWMGLEGLDEASSKYAGYGIHGTIDPTSIGKEMSMGCIRLSDEDVKVVYEMLCARVSVVKIVP